LFHSVDSEAMCVLPEEERRKAARQLRLKAFVYPTHH
jgi:hypothetical protein